MRQLKVGVVQATAVSNEILINVHTVIRLLNCAAKERVGLVVFPELFLCGYDLDAICERPEQAALTLDGNPVKILQDHCAKLKMVSVIGACIKRREGLSNSAIIIDDTGDIVDVYDKINLWTTEQRAFLPGKRLTIFDTAGFRVGIGICYDGAFPEHSRALAMKGAELLIYPSAFAQGAEKHRYHTYFPIRALENTAYVAVSNLIGKAGELTFFGEGVIFDPTGFVLAKAGSHEALITAEVSRERVDEVRQELPYLKELKVDFYHNSDG